MASCGVSIWLVSYDLRVHKEKGQQGADGYFPTAHYPKQVVHQCS